MPVAKWENVDRVSVLGDLEFRSKGRYLREQGWQAVYGTVKIKIKTYRHYQSLRLTVMR